MMPSLRQSEVPPHDTCPRMASDCARLPLQQHAGVTGNLQDMETARMIQRVAAGAVNSGPAPVAGNEAERELACFLEFQASQQGQVHQARVTAASKRLADHVGGHDDGSGTQIATVFLRLSRRVARAPGRWLQKKPLSEERLAALPEGVSSAPHAHSHWCPASMPACVCLAVYACVAGALYAVGMYMWVSTADWVSGAKRCHWEVHCGWAGE